MNSVPSTPAQPPVTNSVPSTPAQPPVTTWLGLPADTAFGVANLPYGVCSRGSWGPRVCVRIGDWALDLASVFGDPTFAAPALNPFLAQGRRRWDEVRARVTHLLTDERGRGVVEPALVPLAEVTLHPPILVGDYVDFYASEHHASELGRILRGSAELPPNWRHMPIGYHGRSGTIVLSGTPVRRPRGQRLVNQAPRSGEPASRPIEPTFGPSQRLDLEVELGFVVGTGSVLGQPVGADAFAEHVFGVCLVNDWSARDLQAWEYVPLGPFLGKSFATSISGWIVPLPALDRAWVAPPPQQPRPLPYLVDPQTYGLDIDLELRLNGHVIARPPYSSMYWTPAQMLAHLTVNGASIRPGDLYASGTVSGPERDQRGSLIELTGNGAEPMTLPDGSTRTFLEDGDEVTISATAPGPGGTRIGFGEVTSRILPP
jgi:fumarylacetoacetase